MDYKIETIAEHSFIPELFSHYPGDVNIIDGGCRGFEFTNEMRRREFNVHPFDIDNLVLFPSLYYRCAISDVNGMLNIKRGSDPQGVRVSKSNEGFSIAEESVNCFTLETISRALRIDIFDLIKLDIEGSEYEVIMSMDRPYAKQLSIEFHLHTGIYGWLEIVMMEDKLKALGYETVQHNLEERHGCPRNYWDSLFVLK